jgi:putative transposase
MRVYKTAINPSEEQIEKIAQTLGVCRFVYNLFIAVNQERYRAGLKYKNGYEFSKWLNNEYRQLHPEHAWIRDVSSKAVKAAIMNSDNAFKLFFKTKKGFPKFKSKHKSTTGGYFPRNNPKDTEAQRHRVKIPTLGWVRLKEYDYIPVGYGISSVTVKARAGRYFICCIVEEANSSLQKPSGEPIGVDLGLKQMATTSEADFFVNINKSSKVHRLKKKLKREQRRFSRKKLYRKKVKTVTDKSANLDKQRIKVQKVYYRLESIRKDYINKIISELVKTKPAYITIEDLNIQGMLKNRHLSAAIAEQNFYYFRTRLEAKCKQYNIELRIADRFYPSSKLCSSCGSVKHDLKLRDRVYICGTCGAEIDRDLNAAMNLKHCEHYQVA